MSKSLHISIPQPCHEDWQKMTAAEKGRFCNACQMVVVDFTKLSDAEILNYFNSEKGKTCGRFTSSQLSRPIETENQYNSSFNYRFFTAVSLLLGLSMPAFTQTENRKKNNIEISNPTEQKLTVQIPGQANDTFIIIRGLVTDEYGDTLVGASVNVKGKTIGTVTNSAGQFELKIPAKYGDSVVTLEVKYISYVTKLITNVKPSENQYLKIYLEEAMLGEMIIGITVPMTPWQKFKYRVKGFFRRIF